MSYVSKIFSVKEWRNLETGGRGRSRSLKMALFDKSHTTFCWSAIVSSSIYLLPFLSYLTLNDIMTLKSGFGVVQGN